MAACSQRNGLRGGILCGLLLVGGCERSSTPKASPPQADQSIEAREAERDRTVWKEEVMAREYEKTFVKLSDKMRSADDKLSVLAQFPFDRIQLPNPRGIAKAQIVGIQQQDFSARETFILSHSDWGRRIAQLQNAGWTLVQFEWQHERFQAASPTNSPFSEFGFELDGQQGASNRFILRGTLRVQWPTLDWASNESPKARQIEVSNLVLLERTGVPGFDN